MIRRFLALIFLVAILAVAFYALRSYRANAGPESLRDIGQKISEVPQQLLDTKVKAAVKAALELNRDLKAHPIEVEASDAAVTLKGEVPSERVRQMAVATARAVPDVREVRDALRVNPGLPVTSSDGDRSLGEKVDDEGLGVQIKLAFSLHRDLKGSDIDVRVHRREVLLSGEVLNTAQRPLALQIASQVDGVRGVKEELRLKGEAAANAASPTVSPIAVEQAVKSNLNLAGYDIRVKDEGGRLRLTGRVRTAAEKDLAGLLAKDAAGRPVENAIEIQP